MAPLRIQDKVQNFKLRLWLFILSLLSVPCTLSRAILNDLEFLPISCFFTLLHAFRLSSCSPECQQHPPFLITNFFILQNSAHLSHYTWSLHRMLFSNSFCVPGFLCKPLFYYLSLHCNQCCLIAYLSWPKFLEA